MFRILDLCFQISQDQWITAGMKNRKVAAGMMKSATICLQHQHYQQCTISVRKCRIYKVHVPGSSSAELRPGSQSVHRHQHSGAGALPDNRHSVDNVWIGMTRGHHRKRYRIGYSVRMRLPDWAYYNAAMRPQSVSQCPQHILFK